MVRLTSQGRSTHWPRQSPPVYEARRAVRRTAAAPTTPTATRELNRRACAASYCKNNQYAACACSAFLRWLAPAWVSVGRTRSKRIHDSSGRGRATAHLSNAISPGGRNETLTPEEQTEVSGFFTATPLADVSACFSESGPDVASLVLIHAQVEDTSDSDSGIATGGNNERHRSPCQSQRRYCIELRRRTFPGQRRGYSVRH